MERIVVHNKNGELAHEYDRAPIDELMLLAQEPAGDPAHERQLLRSLSEYQMRAFVSELLQLTRHYHRLWKASFSAAQGELLEGMRKLNALAKDEGETLWPELDTPA